MLGVLVGLCILPSALQIILLRRVNGKKRNEGYQSRRTSTRQR